VNLPDRTDIRNRLTLLTVLIAAGWLAWTRRFVQDDAFISFRYARNWVNGHGLVFNPGERVEGYTNFLWTLLCALPIKMDWDPVFFTTIVGIGLFTVSLLLGRP